MFRAAGNHRPGPVLAAVNCNPHWIRHRLGRNATATERRIGAKLHSGKSCTETFLSGIGAVTVPNRAADLALRQSYLMAGTETPPFLAFLVPYIGAAILTWARYLRPHPRAQLPG